MDPARAPYLRAGFLLLVLAGGTAGTAVRAWLVATFPPADGGWPWATFAVNVAGSLLLGMLVASLRRRRVDDEQRARLSAALGTGLLGGLTTYSTFAVEVVLLVRDGDGGIGVGYGLLSVLTGIGAAWIGYRAVGR